jgi:hypothetical protein
MALSKEKENPSEALNFYRIQEKLAKTHNSPRHLYVAFSRQAFLENFLGNMKESQRIWKKAQKIYEKHCHNFPQRLREKHAFPLEFPS